MHTCAIICVYILLWLQWLCACTDGPKATDASGLWPEYIITTLQSYSYESSLYYIVVNGNGELAAFGADASEGICAGSYYLD